MSQPFKPGDIVQVNRPNKKEHGYLGRFVEASPDPAFAWVSFLATHQLEHAPPLTTYWKQRYFKRRLFPLSQLEAYTPES